MCVLLCSKTYSCEPCEDETSTDTDHLEALVQMTYSGLPDWAQNHARDTIPPEFINISYSHHYGDVRCRRHRHHHRRDSFQNDLALCKYRYVRSYDSFRVPSTLLTVQCLCNHVSSGGDTVNTFSCEEMFIYIRVKRKVNNENYTYAWEKLAIACIAVRQPSPRDISSTHSRMEE